MLGEIRIDALLPAVRSLRAEPEALRRLQDRDGLEVRRLEEDARRLGGDLGLLAAHDRREGDSALAVLDHHVARVERAQLAVEGAHLLAVVRAPDADDTAVQRLVVERVQRAAERDHHVVRHVDDVRDRAHAGREDARSQPHRRRADAHVAEEAGEIARAAVPVLDVDGDLLVDARCGGSTPGHGASGTSKSAATSRASP